MMPQKLIMTREEWALRWANGDKTKRHDDGRTWYEHALEGWRKLFGNKDKVEYDGPAPSKRAWMR